MKNELKQRLVEAQKETARCESTADLTPVKADQHLGHTVPMNKLRQFRIAVTK